MEIGYIKLHRDIINWEWYDDINTCRLFIHILLKANHVEKKWHGVVIKRGQVLTSLKTLSEETHLSPQKIKTSISKLILTNGITNKSTNKNRLITVSRYDDYQTSTNNPANKQQTNNKQVTTTKNVKNIKNNTVNNKKACSFTKYEFYEKELWVEKAKKRFDWNEETSLHWWKIADNYSNKGNTYIDWLKAVDLWNEKSRVEIKEDPYDGIGKDLFLKRKAQIHGDEQRKIMKANESK
jgi:hypothetical protein